MFEQIRVTTTREPGRRNLLNSLLALATGALALVWPNFLYYIVGGYLIALSMLLFYFRVSSLLTAFTVLMAILIFLFPELIPFSFAFFLAIFGLALLLTIKLTLAGLLALIFAALIMANPGSVAWMIGAFLLLYGFTHLISLFQESRRSL